MADSDTPKRASWFVILSVAFIFMVMAGFVMERVLGISPLSGFSSSGESSDGNAQESLQPAVDVCKRMVKAQLGPALLQADMDRISTRYLPAQQQYFVFLDLIIKGQERTEYYYECTVSAVNQEIVRTRVTGPPGSFDQINLSN